MADLQAIMRAQGCIKLLEVILASICIGLLRMYSLNFGGKLLAGDYYDRYNVGVVTLGGFILITVPLLISYTWNQRGTYQPFLEMIYNGVGFILFLTSGALALQQYYNRTLDIGDHNPAGITMGALCIINALLYLVDANLALHRGTQNSV